MQLSTIPAKIAAIFAASAAPSSKNTIPLTQVGITQPGQASFDVGFPAVTMQPAASGGINPYGQDFNGLGFAVTGVQQWQCGGGGFPFDSAFATTVGGYPKGAVILNLAGDGYWLCLADSNTTNPDTGGANWAPIDGYGITSVTGLTNANVTLTATQYGKPIITLAGTLTGNVQIIFPVLKEEWLVINNCTGAFTVTCIAFGGTGGIVAQAGGQQTFWGDGTNLNPLAGNSALPLSVGTATQSGHAVPLGQVPVFGGVRNLKASLAAAGTSLTFTADAIVVKSALNGISTLLTSYSQTLSLAAGTGAGKMDTGTAPVSGYVAAYATWGPTVGAGIVGQNATSAAAPEQYGGANIPAGVTETQLIGVWPTNPSSQFIVGYQADRELYFTGIQLISTSSGSGTPTSTSISGVVPLNARSLSGNLTGVNNTAPNGSSVSLAATSTLVGQKQASATAALSNAGILTPFSDMPLITPQTMFFTNVAVGGGTSSITANATSYTF